MYLTNEPGERRIVCRVLDCLDLAHEVPVVVIVTVVESKHAAVVDAT